MEKELIQVYRKLHSLQLERDIEKELGKYYGTGSPKYSHNYRTVSKNKRMTPNQFYPAQTQRTHHPKKKRRLPILKLRPIQQNMPIPRLRQDMRKRKPVPQARERLRRSVDQILANRRQRANPR